MSQKQQLDLIVPLNTLFTRKKMKYLLFICKSHMLRLCMKQNVREIQTTVPLASSFNFHEIPNKIIA